MISVCIATYNGADFIDEQLRSILPQLSECDEIIISDDGSTDDTLEIVNSFQDDRVKVYLNSNTRGYTKNFENALNYSKGDIIFLSDQDDVWLGNKVSDVVAALDASDFVVTDCSVVDQDLNIMHLSHFKLHNVQSGFWRNFVFPRYVGACMAFRRNVLEKSLPFPNLSQYVPHDYWISLIAETNFRVHLLNVPSSLYRRHGKNASNGGEKSKVPFLKRVLVRIFTLSYIFLRSLRGDNG